MSVRRKKPNFWEFLYGVWCVFWIVFIYLLIHPFIWISLQRKKKKGYRFAHRLTQVWAAVYFPLIGKKLAIRYDFKPDTSKTYVFVANHFSYLDIAVGMGVVPNFFAYVGKSSVKKIPLLGYMFAKLHIQVDRGEKSSRAKSLIRGIKALESGRSIFIMPEGGIVSKTIPEIHRPFKDGAFIMAIEQRVPIVPITFLNLHEIMPDTWIYGGRPQIVIHPPIATDGLTKDDIPALKEQVYQIIQTTLDTYTNENRRTNG